MNNAKSAAVAALTLSCALFFGAPAAHSATLLDFLKGNNKTIKKNDASFSGSLDDDLGSFPDPARPAKALPKVAPPKYFTYKPDAVRLIAVKNFAPAMETAAADPTQTGSVEAVSLAPDMDFASNPRAFMIDVRAKAPAEVAAAIEKFYGEQKGLIWIDANGVTPKARAAMRALADVTYVGLDPSDYAVVDPTETFASVDAVTRQRQLMQFEIELSAATLTFVQDTIRGRIDPNRISEYHDFKRKAVDLDAAIKAVAASTRIATYLETRTPMNEQFAALKAELSKLRLESGAEEAQVEIAPGTLLKPGQSNTELANVVAAIRHRASDTLKVDHALTLASYQGTPEYTPELVKMVEAFQVENGLKGDGVIGKGTIRKLMGGDTNGSKIEKIKVAMEQLRWLPRDLGPRFVFINQPAFTAYYHNDGKEEFNMRVVVGSPGHQTFFFQDEVEIVEFNPYWGVPRSIIVNEMLPNLRNDPSYLDRLGYETSINGQQVSSSSIDWHSTDAVDVRQPPGRSNALGTLKILFPNTHSIYMHDTPQKKFFERDMRALSHGCVRLVDPKKMAAAVLNMSVPEIEAAINTGKNHQMKVPQKFPVYVSYFTAFPNKDGVVEYFDDVYSRDTYMDRAFTATRKARTGES